MAKRRKSAMDWYIVLGMILVFFCILVSGGAAVGNLLIDRGIAMIADVIAAVAAIITMITVGIYYKDPEMYEIPAVCITVFMAANLIRVLGISWVYLFHIIPIVLMVLTIMMRWNVFGIAAGGALVVTNLIVSVAYFYVVTHWGLISAYVKPGAYLSAYVGTQFFNANSLMGIACMLFYITVKDGPGAIMDANKRGGNNDPFGGGGFDGGFNGGFGGSGGTGW